MEPEAKRPRLLPASALDGMFAHAPKRAADPDTRADLRPTSFACLLAAKKTKKKEDAVRASASAVAWDSDGSDESSLLLRGALQRGRERRGLDALSADWSLRSCATFVATGGSFAWALPAAADDAAALEGIGRAALPDAAPQTRLLHALQRFELRLSAASDASVALRSLMARVGSPAVPCFYVLGAAVAVLVRSPSRAAVHPASALRTLLGGTTATATATASAASADPLTPAEEEELAAIEKAAGGIMAVRRPGDMQTAAETRAQAAADACGPPAVIDGDVERVQRLVDAIVASATSQSGPCSTALVVSPGAFVGGTLCRGNLSVTSAVCGERLEEVSLLRITDSALSQQQLLTLLEVVSANTSACFSAELGNVIGSTAMLSTEASGSFVCRVDWAPAGQGFRCFVTATSSAK